MARSAPRRRQASHFSAEPAVAITWAPNALPSWMAAVPMPEEPPWTSNVSPAFRLEGVVPHGKEGLGDGCSGDQREPCRDRQRVTFVRGAVFGIAAAHYQRHDVVTEIPARHARTERNHFACDLETWDIGRVGGRRIKALALHHVRPIDARGRDLHQHLAFAGARERALLGDEHVRSTGRADRDRGHLGGQCGYCKSPWLTRLAALCLIGRRGCDNGRLGGYFRGGLERRRAMPVVDEDDRPKKKVVHEIGQDLVLLSVKELEERIAVLKSEIGRLQAAIASQHGARTVADQFFKK